MTIFVKKSEAAFLLTGSLVIIAACSGVVVCESNATAVLGENSCVADPSGVMHQLGDDMALLGKEVQKYDSLFEKLSEIELLYRPERFCSKEAYEEHLAYLFRKIPRTDAAIVVSKLDMDYKGCCHVELESIDWVADCNRMKTVLLAEAHIALYRGDVAAAATKAIDLYKLGCFLSSHLGWRGYIYGSAYMSDVQSFFIQNYCSFKSLSSEESYISICHDMCNLESHKRLFLKAMTGYASSIVAGIGDKSLAVRCYAALKEDVKELVSKIEFDRRYDPAYMQRNVGIERKRVRVILKDSLGSETVDYVSANALYKMFWERQLRLEFYKVSFAMNKYLDSNGRFPPTIRALVPQFFATIPIDPYDGEELRYCPSQRILWSPGPLMDTRLLDRYLSGELHSSPFVFLLHKPLIGEEWQEGAGSSGKYDSEVWCAECRNLNYLRDKQ